MSKRGQTKQTKSYKLLSTWFFQLFDIKLAGDNYGYYVNGLCNIYNYLKEFKPFSTGNTIAVLQLKQLNQYLETVESVANTNAYKEYISSLTKHQQIKPELMYLFLVDLNTDAETITVMQHIRRIIRLQVHYCLNAISTNVDEQNVFWYPSIRSLLTMRRPDLFNDTDLIYIIMTTPQVSYIGWFAKGVALGLMETIVAHAMVVGHEYNETESELLSYQKIHVLMFFALLPFDHWLRTELLSHLNIYDEFKKKSMEYLVDDLIKNKFLVYVAIESMFTTARMYKSSLVLQSNNKNISNVIKYMKTEGSKFLGAFKLLRLLLAKTYMIDLPKYVFEKNRFSAPNSIMHDAIDLLLGLQAAKFEGYQTTSHNVDVHEEEVLGVLVQIKDKTTLATVAGQLKGAEVRQTYNKLSDETLKLYDVDKDKEIAARFKKNHMVRNDGSVRDEEIIGTDEEDLETLTDFKPTAMETYDNSMLRSFKQVKSSLQVFTAELGSETAAAREYARVMGTYDVELDDDSEDPPITNISLNDRETYQKAKKDVNTRTGQLELAELRHNNTTAILTNALARAQREGNPEDVQRIEKQLEKVERRYELLTDSINKRYDAIEEGGEEGLKVGQTEEMGNKKKVGQEEEEGYAEEGVSSDDEKYIQRMLEDYNSDDAMATDEEPEEPDQDRSAQELAEEQEYIETNEKYDDPKTKARIQRQNEKYNERLAAAEQIANERIVRRLEDNVTRQKLAQKMSRQQKPLTKHQLLIQRIKDSQARAKNFIKDKIMLKKLRRAPGDMPENREPSDSDEPITENVDEAEEENEEEEEEVIADAEDKRTTVLRKIYKLYNDKLIYASSNTVSAIQTRDQVKQAIKHLADQKLVLSDDEYNENRLESKSRDYILKNVTIKKNITNLISTIRRTDRYYLLTDLLFKNHITDITFPTDQEDTPVKRQVRELVAQYIQNLERATIYNAIHQYTDDIKTVLQNASGLDYNQFKNNKKALEQKGLLLPNPFMKKKSKATTGGTNQPHETKEAESTKPEELQDIPGTQQEQEEEEEEQEEIKDEDAPAANPLLVSNDFITAQGFLSDSKTINLTSLMDQISEIYQRHHDQLTQDELAHTHKKQKFQLADIEEDSSDDLLIWNLKLLYVLNLELVDLNQNYTLPYSKMVNACLTLAQFWTICKLVIKVYTELSVASTLSGNSNRVIYILTRNNLNPCLTEMVELLNDHRDFSNMVSRAIVTMRMLIKVYLMSVVDVANIGPTLTHEMIRVIEQMKTDNETCESDSIDNFNARFTQKTPIPVDVALHREYLVVLYLLYLATYKHIQSDDPNDPLIDLAFWLCVSNPLHHRTSTDSHDMNSMQLSSDTRRALVVGRLSLMADEEFVKCLNVMIFDSFHQFLLLTELSTASAGNSETLFQPLLKMLKKAVSDGSEIRVGQYVKQLDEFTRKTALTRFDSDRLSREMADPLRHYLGSVMSDNQFLQTVFQGLDKIPGLPPASTPTVTTTPTPRPEQFPRPKPQPKKHRQQSESLETPAPTPIAEPTPTPEPVPEPTPTVETSSNVVNLDTITSTEPVAATPIEPATYTTTEPVAATPIEPATYTTTETVAATPTEPEKQRSSDLEDDHVAQIVADVVTWIESDDFRDVLNGVTSIFEEQTNLETMALERAQNNPTERVDKSDYDPNNSYEPVVNSFQFVYIAYQTLNAVYPFLSTSAQKQILRLLQLDQFWALYQSIVLVYTHALIYLKSTRLTKEQVIQYNFKLVTLNLLLEYIDTTNLQTVVNGIGYTFQHWTRSFLVRWVNPRLFDLDNLSSFEQNLDQLRQTAFPKCPYLDSDLMLSYVEKPANNIEAKQMEYVEFSRLVMLYYVTTVVLGSDKMGSIYEMFIMAVCDMTRPKSAFKPDIDQFITITEFDTPRRYIFRNVYKNLMNTRCITYQLCKSFIQYIVYTTHSFLFNLTDVAPYDKHNFGYVLDFLNAKYPTLTTAVVLVQANRIHTFTRRLLDINNKQDHLPADLSQTNLVLRSTEQSQTSDQPAGVVQEAEEEKSKEGSAAEMVETLITIEENQVAETEEGAIQIANNLDHLENLSNDMNELGTTEEELKRAVESDVFGQTDNPTDFLPNLPSPEMEDLSQTYPTIEKDEEEQEEEEEEEAEEEEEEKEQDFLADIPDEGDIGQYENVLNQSIRSQHAKLYQDLTDNPEGFASGRSPGPSPTAFGQPAATKIMNELKELESTTETTEQAATTAADLMAYKEHDLDQLQTKEQEEEEEEEEVLEEGEVNEHTIKGFLEQFKSAAPQSRKSKVDISNLINQYEPELTKHGKSKADISNLINPLKEVIPEKTQSPEKERLKADLTNIVKQLKEVIPENPQSPDKAILKADLTNIVKQLKEVIPEKTQSPDKEILKADLTNIVKQLKEVIPEKNKSSILEKSPSYKGTEEKSEEESEEDIEYINQLENALMAENDSDEELISANKSPRENIDIPGTTNTQSSMLVNTIQDAQLDAELQADHEEEIKNQKELEQLAKTMPSTAKESTPEKQTIEPEQEQESSEEEEEELNPDLNWQAPQTQEERDKYYAEMIRRYPKRRDIIRQMRATEEKQRQSYNQSQQPNQPQTMTEEQEEVPMDVEPEEQEEQESRQAQRHAPNLTEQIDRHHAEQLIRQHNEQVQAVLGGGRASTLSPEWRFSSVSVSDADWLLVKWNHRLNDLYHVPHFANPYNFEPDQQTYQLYEYEIAGRVYFASALSHDALKTVFNKNLLKHNPPAGKLADYHHPTYHSTTNNPDAIITVELFPINWYDVFIMFLKVVFAYILKSATIDENDKYLEFLRLVSYNKFFEDATVLQQNQISLAGLVENLAEANPDSVLVGHLQHQAVDVMFNQLFNVWYVYKCPVQYQLSLVSGVLANTSPLYYAYLDDKHFTHQLNLVWYDVRQHTRTALSSVDPNARANTHTIPVSSTNYHSMRVELKGNGTARKSGPLLMPRDPIIYDRTRATQEQLDEAAASDQVDGLFVNGLDVIMLTMFEWYNTSMIPLSQILDPYFQATAARARATNRGKR